MMKHIHLQIDGTTSSVKRPLLLRDPARLVGMRVVCSTAQAAAATVAVGENGATHTVFTADLNPTDALEPVEAAYTAEVTDDEKQTVFGPDKPLEIDVNLASAGKVALVLELDPFLIG